MRGYSSAQAFFHLASAVSPKLLLTYGHSSQQRLHTGAQIASFRSIVSLTMSCDIAKLEKCESELECGNYTLLSLCYAPMVPRLPQEHEAFVVEVGCVGCRDGDVSNPEGKSE